MRSGQAHQCPEVLDELAREIENLRRRYAPTRRELPDAREALASWAAEVNGLCWFLPLADVVEADIDVEILREVLIVRASRAWPDPAVLVSILPVPYEFDPSSVIIRFTEETLMVRIRWVPGRDTS